MPLDPSRIAAARPAALPAKLAPQLPTLVAEPPDGDDWLHEMKVDGYRFLAWIDHGNARSPVVLRTRRSIDWTSRLPRIAHALAALPAKTAILDGEVAVARPEGTHDFNALQNALDGHHDARAVFYAFDLMHLNAYDLTHARLEDRKAALRDLLVGVGLPLRLNDHVVGEGRAFFASAVSVGLEGIVSKRRDAPYEQGRSNTWLKTKARPRQEVVVGGFTVPASGTATRIGGLLVGVYDGDKLMFAGGVGSGFTVATSGELRRALALVERPTSPFANEVVGQEMSRVRWVEPRVVVEVAFSEWTADGRLRHASFQGVRLDKEPGEVARQQETS